MLMSDVFVALAQAHGIVFRPSPALGVHAPLTLTGPDMPATPYDVHTTGALYPSRVRRYSVDRYALAAARPRPLVIAASATRAARDTALEVGVSLLVAPDGGPVTGVLIDASGRTHVVDAPTAHEAADEAPRRSGRTPWGAYALAISLLHDPTPRSQAALACEVSLTQPRVSQALRDMHAFVAREPAGWAVRDSDQLARWLRDRYPQPRTSATWLTLDAPVLATRAIAGALEDAGVRYAVTGQVAADSYAPWARPTRTTIWADQLVDLSAVGCTPARATDATVTIAVPDDPYALQDATLRGGLHLADPWRVWLTLAQDGDDAAADRLREKLVQAA
ncbi:hypothetical protein CTKZ_17010 [Cellulomonas algicola]|uniref:Uncharacterized protein n=1 Tax=Cellulomonas algicola TaxID=2071633 RepID=A0A401UZM5_9CELL|nr:hypothetical protein [Cellulomonas algicola]GCD20139.1 hypothetical protein CTKZ_17010 [Cellulomonas algicola]